VVAAASDLGACVYEDDATVSDDLSVLLARVAELEFERDEAKDLDAMDDAVHVASPWEPRKSLCGQWNRRNLAPLDRTGLDEGSGCWSCMDAAKWIHDRSRVQAEQIAALQEALRRVARRGPDQPSWSRALYAQCQVIAREALALAEGCAAPAPCPECGGRGEVAATPGQPGDGPMPCPTCAAPADEEEK
jgi:hypothetical protein